GEEIDADLRAAGHFHLPRLLHRLAVALPAGTNAVRVVLLGCQWRRDVNTLGPLLRRRISVEENLSIFWHKNGNLGRPSPLGSRGRCQGPSTLWRLPVLCEQQRADMTGRPLVAPECPQREGKPDQP